MTLNSEGSEKSPVKFLYSELLELFAISAALESWSAKIIKTIEGGIIWPNVPEAQNFQWTMT